MKKSKIHIVLESSQALEQNTTNVVKRMGCLNIIISHLKYAVLPKITDYDKYYATKHKLEKYEEEFQQLLAQVKEE